VEWLNGGGGGNRTPRGNLIAANGFEVREAHQSLSASAEVIEQLENITALRHPCQLPYIF